MPLEVVVVPCRTDNYAYLLRDTASGRVGLVDAPEAGPIAAALAARGWGLHTILLTHRHDDHIAGVAELVAGFGAEVTGPAGEKGMPPLDRAVAEGDTVALGESRATVLDVPGHTLGHIAYHFADAEALFSADSLMVMGCGRVFEGTLPQMWQSLAKMAALPDTTMVYSGHEYAEGNLRFALSVDAANPALQARAAEIAALRKNGAPTVPALLGLERQTNPFLRVVDPGFKAGLGLSGSSDAQVFAEVRRRKDSF
ncbi:MAG: hydroxyacylglutathione hydrolase [Amaricoccus sp.]|uniref:hydroxyacylglutathione hydrolase n=1 Tax=Amaricoccus sp. TaxID=1872485 RepID=UPI0039E57221